MRCNECGAECISIAKLASHVRWQHKREQLQRKCRICSKLIDVANILKHELACAKPKNICKWCSKETRNDNFCDKSCSAEFLNREGKIGFSSYRRKYNIFPKETYRDVCFKQWEMRCVICGWDVSVDVHHIDDNHQNDDPTNLIPLCQNHHHMTCMNEHRELMRDKLKQLVNEKFGVTA